MKDLRIYYDSYDLRSGSQERNRLDITVTDYAADTIMHAAVLSPDYSQLAPIDAEVFRVLQTLQRVCEGIEQLSGRSIFKRGCSRPWKYCGLELDFEAYIMDVEETDEDDADEEG